MYRGGGGVKILIFFENMKKKKFQSAFFIPPGRWSGNNFLFKGGLIETKLRGIDRGVAVSLVHFLK